jgi:hypothetical protein
MNSGSTKLTYEQRLYVDVQTLLARNGGSTRRRIPNSTRQATRQEMRTLVRELKANGIELNATNIVGGAADLTSRSLVLRPATTPHGDNQKKAF